MGLGEQVLRTILQGTISCDANKDNAFFVHSSFFTKTRICKDLQNSSFLVMHSLADPRQNVLFLDASLN